MNMLRPFLFSFSLALALVFATASQDLAAFDGRVFFSSNERRALETKPTASDIPAPVAAPPPPPPKRRFDGSLWRDGRIIALWFDGAPADPASEPAIRIGDDIPGTTVSGRRQPLLPGQSWPPQSRDSGP
jgi:hypothetical protein